MTRALIEQMIEALRHAVPNDSKQSKEQLDAIKMASEYLATEPTPTLTETLAQQGIKLRTEFESKQRNVDLAPEPSGERAKLIGSLRRCRSPLGSMAADMLEADVSLINEGNKAQQVAVPEVQWGVDWGSNGDRSCVSIIKRHPDGTLEVVAIEHEPQRGEKP